MKNRRLLIILLTFIVVGTLTVLGGVLLSVDVVTVTFSNEFDFFKGEDPNDIADSLRVSVLPVTMDKNNLFGINDKKVIKAIEEDNETYGSRVRVTNIERKFPNRVEILVRERYPVYKLALGNDMTAVVCGRLYVLDILNEDDFATLEDTASWPLIVMPPEVGNGLDLDQENIGKFLTGDEPETAYVKILKELAPHFSRLGRLSSFEDAICNIFRSVEFSGVEGSLTLTMRSRHSSMSLLRNDFEFIIENADVEPPRLRKMLTKGWQALHRYNTHVGRFKVVEQATYDGQKVQDGILVLITGFGDDEVVGWT